MASSETNCTWHCLPKLHWWGAGHIWGQPIMQYNGEMKSMLYAFFIKGVCMERWQWEWKRWLCESPQIEVTQFYSSSCRWPFNLGFGASSCFTAWMAFQVLLYFAWWLVEMKIIPWLLLVTRSLISVIKCLSSSNNQHSDNAAPGLQLRGSPASEILQRRREEWSAFSCLSPACTSPFPYSSWHVGNWISWKEDEGTDISDASIMTGPSLESWLLTGWLCEIHTF